MNDPLNLAGARFVSAPPVKKDAAYFRDRARRARQQANDVAPMHRGYCLRNARNYEAMARKLERKRG